jgi:hypothetical protein
MAMGKSAEYSKEFNTRFSMLSITQENPSSRSHPCGLAQIESKYLGNFANGCKQFYIPDSPGSMFRQDQENPDYFKR